MHRIVILAVWALTGVAVADRAQWAQFRGPDAGAMADEPSLPDTWRETENVVLHRRSGADTIRYRSPPWPARLCPMLLTHRMAYRHEFLGGGLFPLWSWRPVVESVRRGPGRSRRSDLVSRASRARRYRVRDFLAARGDAWRALNAETCPLSGADLVDAKRSFLHTLFRLCLLDVRDLHWARIRARLCGAGIRWRDVLRYPPKRFYDARAGSRLDENGEYTVPDRVSLSGS